MTRTANAAGLAALASIIVAFAPLDPIFIGMALFSGLLSIIIAVRNEP